MRPLLAVIIAVLLSIPALAQDDAAQVAALRKEIAELQARRAEARRATEKSEPVAVLRKLRDDSAQKYADLEKSDPALAAAAKALKEAQAAADKLLADKSTASPEAAKLNAQRDELESQRHSLMLQDQIAQLKLTSPHSPVQQALDKDAGLAALRKAYQAVDPKDKAARDAARQKFDDARKTSVEKLPQAKPLVEERAKIKDSLAVIDKQSRQLEEQSRSIRETIRKGTDADLNAAKEKVAAAQKEMQAARDAQRLKAARDEARAAEQALHDKVSQLIDADPSTKDLKTSIDAKQSQLAELQKKLKKVEKK